MRFTRRKALFAAVGFGGVLTAARYGQLRAARSAPPSGPLSRDATALIAKAWLGLDPSKVIDTHVHVVGLGTGGTGCEVGARMQSFSSPMERFKLSMYLEASGITDTEHADQQYIERLKQLVATPAPHGRALVLAFDHAYSETGELLADESEFYTPNEYVTRLAKESPSLFAACASVHPYRADAIQALEAAVEQGAVAVKWLPNAMGIDPSSPKCDPFYDALARLNVPLISHAGEEKAVHAEEKQRLGNPLHLRRPLEHGVTVVVAHCASLGKNPDLDNPQATEWVDNFELFMRLMNEPKWNGKLFGEISAMTLFNRLGSPLRRVLSEPVLRGRLINASDYPIPAINALMQTRAIVAQGLITEAERALLNEIEQHNPLLFDFVLKRTLVLRENGIDHRFDESIFHLASSVFPRLRG